MTVVAVLLAAGAGSRFRDVGHKLSAELPERLGRPVETVFTRALASVEAARIGATLVVTGQLDAEQLGIADRDDIVVVHNPDWSRGQATSVRAALDAAEQLGATVAVFGLADQPGIDASSWVAVADQAADGAPIAVATYDGHRGNPVALRREIWQLLPSEGDEGARSLMRLRPDLVREVPCTGSPDDIDTVEDLQRWQNN